MSPYSNLSMGTTPLHHPDEDLTNFHHTNTNVYAPRPLLMPQTPVSP